MIAGQGIDSVAQTILAQRSLKKDYVADTRALKVTDEGRLAFTIKDQPIEFDATNLCLRQIGDRVGIPAKYVDRMMTEAPALLARNVNHWFASKPEKRMLRTLQNGSNIARAFLSDGYRPLDNIDISAHILPKLGEAGCEIKSAAITDSRLYIQAIIPRMEKAIAKVGDVVQSGVVISNSEVGCGSLWIEHMVYTLRCTNGMIGSNVVKRSHVGRKSGNGLDIDEAREFFTDETRQADDRAFWLKVSDLVKHALSQEMFDAAVAKLDDAASVEIAKPIEVIEIMGSKFDWQKDEQASVLEHFIKGGQVSQYGLLNAVTRTAQDLASYDRAVEFERMGGEIMLLKPSDFAVN